MLLVNPEGEESIVSAQQGMFERDLRDLADKVYRWKLLGSNPITAPALILELPSLYSTYRDIMNNPTMMAKLRETGAIPEGNKITPEGNKITSGKMPTGVEGQNETEQSKYQGIMPGGRLQRFLNNIDWLEVASALAGASDPKLISAVLQYINLKAEYYARQDAQVMQTYDRLLRRRDALASSLPNLSGAQRQEVLDEMARLDGYLRHIDETYFGVPPAPKPKPKKQGTSRSINVIDFLRTMVEATREAIPWALKQLKSTPPPPPPLEETNPYMEMA